MKKTFNKTLMLIALMIFVSTMSNAQRFVVRVKPAAPVAVRIASPGPRHIWIEGDWVWRGHNYVYKPGYWYLPLGRERWIPGHWKATRGGWVWIPGHWKHRRR